MAIFNPPINQDGDNYLRYSRGAGVDNSMATLLSGAGDIISTAATGWKGYQEVALRKAAEQEIDPQIDPQTVKNMGTPAKPMDVNSMTGNQILSYDPNAVTDEGATSVPSSPTAGNLVPGSAAAGREINKLGVTAGRLGKFAQSEQGYETYHQMQVEAAVRRLRARFPGFREEIDREVSQIIGAPGANAARKAYVREQEAILRQQASSQNQAYQYLKANEAIIGQLGDKWKNMSMSEIQDYVMTQKGISHRRDEAAKDFELLAKQGKYSQEQAESYALAQGTKVIDSQMNTLYTVMGGDKLGKDISAIAGQSIKLSPEQIQASNVVLGQIRSQAELGLNRMLDTTIVDDGTGKKVPLRSVLKEHSPRVIQQLMSRIDVIDKAFREPSAASLQMLKNQNETIKSTTLNKLLENRASRVLVAAQEMGPQVFKVIENQMFKPGSPFMQDFEKVLRDTVLGETVTDPDKRSPTLQGTVDELRRGLKDPVTGRDNLSPQLLNSIHKTHIGVLGDPEASPEIASRAARFLFDPSTKKYFNTALNPEAQKKAYQDLASPAVTANMIKLRDQGYAKEWFDYKDFVVESGKQLASRALADAQSAISDPRFNIYQDPNNFLLGVIPAPGFEHLARTKPKYLEEQVVGVNRLINILKPIIEADGDDVPTKLQEYLGLDFTAPKDEPGKATSKAIKDADKAFTESGTKVLQNIRQGVKDFFLGTDGQPVSRPMPNNPTGRGTGPRSEAPLSLDESVQRTSYAPENRNPALEYVAGLEVGQNNADPYNTVLGHGRYGMPPKPLTEMTLAEAYRFGRQVRENHIRDVGDRSKGSSALGKYQIVGSTMFDAANALGLDWNTTRFDEQTQDRLAEWILANQGPGAWAESLSGAKLRKFNQLRGQRAESPLANPAGVISAEQQEAALRPSQGLRGSPFPRNISPMKDRIERLRRREDNRKPGEDILIPAEDIQDFGGDTFSNRVGEFSQSENIEDKRDLLPNLIQRIKNHGVPRSVTQTLWGEAVGFMAPDEWGAEGRVSKNQNTGTMFNLSDVDRAKDSVELINKRREDLFAIKNALAFYDVDDPDILNLLGSSHRDLLPLAKAIFKEKNPKEIIRILIEDLELALFGDTKEGFNPLPLERTPAQRVREGFETGGTMPRLENK